MRHTRYVILVVLGCLILVVGTSAEAGVAARSRVFRVEAPSGKELIIDPGDLGQKAHANNKAGKIHITKEKIVFTDISGNETARYDLRTAGSGRWPSIVNLSRGNKHIVVNNIFEYEKEYVKNADLVLMDSTGRKLKSMKHHYYDVIPSPNGDYFVGVSDPGVGDAPIMVFNDRGTIAEISKNDSIWSLDFSPEGDFFAVTTVTIERDVDNNHQYVGNLHVMDGTGKPLYQQHGIAYGTESFCSVFIGEDAALQITTGFPVFRQIRMDKTGVVLP